LCRRAARGSLGTISSHTFFRFASIQKSVSTAEAAEISAACIACSLPYFVRQANNNVAWRTTLVRDTNRDKVIDEQSTQLLRSSCGFSVIEALGRPPGRYTLA
jgi:hypothetical protein